MTEDLLANNTAYKGEDGLGVWPVGAWSQSSKKDWATLVEEEEKALLDSLEESGEKRLVRWPLPPINKWYPFEKAEALSIEKKHCGPDLREGTDGEEGNQGPLAPILASLEGVVDITLCAAIVL